MSERADGTVSFLLSDIEGSTRLVHEAGEAYRQILSDKRRILREAVAQQGGDEIDAHGDELFAAFADANAAAAASVAAQRALIEHEWPDGHDVRVRMGIHTGAALVTEDGYTGIDVHRAARIGSAGHGGQILVSAPTQAVLDRHRPRATSAPTASPGLPAPEHIYQLLADGLPRDFPPLRNTIAHARQRDARRHRRRLRAPPRGRRSPARRVGLRRRRPVRQRQRICCATSPCTSRTWRSSTSACRRRIRTKGSPRPARSASATPATGVLVLSQYVEAGYAIDLLAEGAEGVGYLLKDRVSDLEEFAGAVRRVGEGGSALDPAVVSQLVGRRRQHDPLDELTPREREVLELMAEGRSNQAIAERMFVTLRAVEKHVTSIFTKLGLPASTDDHRRVLAVLAYLQG